ncbi:MAG: 16S rRNA (guanine(966)-N(2))-methyltransferase RsmD [Gemmatimonadetes bacterium]|nr:16S rRNA (guanine(966)-N(2))-methyltransferase RsmD [Gemmatimonadota bacterium]
MRIIAGEWRGRTIRAPSGKEVRPTTGRIREAWMSALGGRLEDARVVDLFAGSGALGLEALSRGANEVTFVEQSRTALAALERNVESLSAWDRVRIVRADALRFVADWSEAPFDLALADPPYDRGFAGRLLERISERPFARELWVEHRSKESLPELPGVRKRKYGDTTISIWELPE